MMPNRVVLQECYVDFDHRSLVTGVVTTLLSDVKVNKKFFKLVTERVEFRVRPYNAPGNSTRVEIGLNSSPGFVETEIDKLLQWTKQTYPHTDILFEAKLFPFDMKHLIVGAVFTKQGKLLLAGIQYQTVGKATTVASQLSFAARMDAKLTERIFMDEMQDRIKVAGLDISPKKIKNNTGDQQVGRVGEAGEEGKASEEKRKSKTSVTKEEVVASTRESVGKVVAKSNGHSEKPQVAIPQATSQSIPQSTSQATDLLRPAESSTVISSAIGVATSLPIPEVEMDGGGVETDAKELKEETIISHDDGATEVDPSTLQQRNAIYLSALLDKPFSFLNEKKGFNWNGKTARLRSVLSANMATTPKKLLMLLADLDPTEHRWNEFLALLNSSARPQRRLGFSSSKYLLDWLRGHQFLPKSFRNDTTDVSSTSSSAQSAEPAISDEQLMENSSSMEDQIMPTADDYSEVPADTIKTVEKITISDPLDQPFSFLEKNSVHRRQVRVNKLCRMLTANNISTPREIISLLPSPNPTEREWVEMLIKLNSNSPYFGIGPATSSYLLEWMRHKQCLPQEFKTPGQLEE